MKTIYFTLFFTFFFFYIYFSFPKHVRLSCIHYIFFKLNNKRELQNIGINNSADIDSKGFVDFTETLQKNLF